MQGLRVVEIKAALAQDPAIRITLEEVSWSVTAINVTGVLHDSNVGLLRLLTGARRWLSGKRNARWRRRACSCPARQPAHARRRLPPRHA